MNEAQIFQSKEFGSVRVLEREDGLRKEEAWTRMISKNPGSGWASRRTARSPLCRGGRCRRSATQKRPAQGIFL